MKSRVYRQDPGMVFREIAGEMILVPINSCADQTDSIFVLNETGARFWELLDGSRSISEIADLFVDEYQVDRDTILEDLEDYAKELLAAGAIAPVSDTEGSGGG